MLNLFTTLMSIHPLSDGLQEYLAKTLKTKKVPKKEFILKAGQVCQHICFIESGLVRCFYEKNDKEICSWFMKENDIILSVHSFFQQIISYENAQALEDTVVHYISYDELQFIYNTFPEFNLHGRVITERYYALSEERLFYMRMHTAIERYTHLLKHFPELILRVSNTDIASYIGITVETLSRIKKNLRDLNVQ